MSHFGQPLRTEMGATILSDLSRQCLARRISDQTTLIAGVEVWETTRNRVGSRFNTQFTTQLSQISPQFE